MYKNCTPNGFTWKLKVSAGNLTIELEYKHSEFVVLKLAGPNFQRGAINYAEIFFSSVPLAEKLLLEKSNQ